ncbi:D-3-phosphoglycerate dehydrogenase [Lipomyces kononenkoae]|uniref:D-3-phosphoglycerate dehydrogenase n=1 Tax=Lipomyces kononenkoae TaxID=34357 RepID=A0ACC3T7A4_LIPKO
MYLSACLQHRKTHHQRVLNTMSSPAYKIAILDDYQNVAEPYFLNLKDSHPGIFEVTSFPETLPAFNLACQADQQKLVERLRPFDIISTMRERTPFPASLLRELPNLKLLLTTGERNLGIDSKAARELGIVVAGAPGRGDSGQVKPVSRIDSTTQHVWALILGITRKITQSDVAVKSGKWQIGFATGIAQKTIGLVGLGRLGGLTGFIAKTAFDMNVICWSRNLTQDAADERAQALGLEAEDFNGVKTFRVVSKEELFKSADIVSIHYILSESTRGIVGNPELSLMKNSSFLINTSRGPIVDESALLEVLKAGRIRGAAIDVFEVEPLPLHSEWRTTKWGENGASDVLLSPHMGYVEEMTLRNWYIENAENVRRWANGQSLLFQLN